MGAYGRFMIASSKWHLCLGAMIGALAFASIAGFFGGWIWWLDLFSHFRAHYALLAVVLAGVALAIRKFKGAAVAFVLLIANLMAMVPHVSLAPAEASSLTFKVVALNLKHDNRHTEEVLAFLRRENADVVILSEVDGPWGPVLQSLSDAYAYRQDALDCDEIGCKASFLSKHPWQEAFVDQFVAGVPPTIGARFRLDGNEFTVIGFHLVKPISPQLEQKQSAQLLALSALINGIGGRVVLAGDMNLTPYSWRYSQFISATGLWRAQGSLYPTWPTILGPLGIPIDHVFVGSEIEFATLRTGPPLGSDHLPVISLIRLGE